MRSALLLNYGRSILGLAATALVACGGDVTPSGSSGSGSSSGGSGDVCKHAVSGTATPVEIVLRNMGSMDLGYLTVCGSAWRIKAPNDAYAPAGVFSLLCDKVENACPADCLDPAEKPVPAGTDAQFMWDGVLYEPVNAVTNQCPAADSGDFCPPTCRRRVDAPPGMYTLEAYLYPAGQVAITKMTTFMYPNQTKIEIVFP